MEKSEPSHIAGKCEQYSCYGKQYLRKLSIELLDDQQFQSKVYTWEKWNMSIQTLVPEYSQQYYNSQTVANNLNVHWLMNRLNVVGIPTQQIIIWPLKKLIHATMWLNLAGGKNAQSKKPDTRGHIIALMWNVQKRQIHREKSRLVVVKGWRMERSRKRLLAREVLGFILGEWKNFKIRQWW